MTRAAGAIRTRQLGMKVARLWLPIRGFAGFDNDGEADISLSQGTPTLEPVTTIEIAALAMTTADEIHTVIPLPWDMDRTKQVAGRVWFIHASTDAGDKPVFKVGVLFYGKQATAAEMAAGADVVTTITHPGTSATNLSVEITNWTDLSWHLYLNDNDMLAGISLELDALGSASADECRVIGLELAYQINQAESHPQTIKGFIANNPK